MHRFVKKAVLPAGCGLARRGLVSLPGYVTSTTGVTTKKLPNGVTVATETVSGNLAVVSAWIDSGSRSEGPGLSGASNLITKLALKGYEADVAKLGGAVNAWTSRETTVFSATVLQSHVAEATSLLGKLVTSPRFTDSDVNAAKEEVLANIERQTLAAHEELVFEHLHETAYQGSPLSQPLQGQADVVATLTRDKLGDFMKNNFTGSRIAVAGTGAVSQDALASAVDSWSVGGPGEKDVAAPLVPSIFVGSDIRARFDSYPFAHVAFGYETAGWTSKIQVPLMVIQTMIGSWDKASGVGSNGTSRLSRKVADENLASSFSAFNLAYKDTGLFGVYVVAPDNKLEDMMWHTLYQLMKIVHQAADYEVDFAKWQLKANYLNSVSSVTGANDNIGRQLLAYGRVMSPAEFFARVDGVEVTDVKQVADQVINDQDHALAAVGPLHELPDYNYIRRRSYWLRY